MLRKNEDITLTNALTARRTVAATPGTKKKRAGLVGQRRGNPLGREGAPRSAATPDEEQAAVHSSERHCKQVWAQMDFV